MGGRQTKMTVRVNVVGPAIASLAVGLTACATPQPIGPGLDGDWSNAAQFEAASEDLKRPPAPGHPYDWIDEQYARFIPVSAPALGEMAVYLEWRAGGAQGEISRQRLWVFRSGEDNQVLMDFYTFRNAEPYAGLTADDGTFAALTAEDLIGYGEACALPVTDTETGWRAAIPDTCVIVARSGRTMTLSAEIAVSDALFTYSEAGVLEGGDIAFKVPGGPPYRFTPVE